MTAKALPQDPVPFITLPNWIKAATYCGFKIEPIFRELGIQTNLLNLETSTISQPLLEQAMEACIARSERHHFPFVLGETFAFEYLPDIETFLNTSSTLREALRVFDWVRELINPMISVELQEKGRMALLILAADIKAKPYFIETTFSSIVKFSRTLLGEQMHSPVLQFRYPAPSYAAAYEPFFNLPVSFNQAHNALVFDRTILDTRLEGAFPDLHKQAQRLVEQRLQRLPRRTGLVTMIETLLERDVRLFSLGMSEVARRLDIGPRTLQRRLHESDETYASVMGRVRYRLAMRYLREPGCDIEAVSERLGFSDRRSFTRAFTRWSGVTPSTFRPR